MKQEGDNYFLLVEWSGLPHVVDNTWEPLSQIFQDVPGVVQDYMAIPGFHKLKRQALDKLKHIHAHGHTME